jgi:RHS repeat-associated protein
VESDLASGGTYLSGASTIWFPFSGDSFSLHALAYSNGGRVRLFVDGQPLDIIDLYEPVFASAAEPRVFSYEGFGPGDHVLTIVGYQYSAYIDRIDTPGTAPFIDPSAPVSGVVRYEGDHPGLAFNGVPLTVAPVSWETLGNILSSGASQGELVRSSVADDAIEFVFDSEWLGLGFFQDDRSGQAEISINGDVVETLDLYSRDSRSLSRYYRDLGPGPHSARIRVLGTASPASAGTRVAFDYAEVWDGQPLADGTFEDTDEDRVQFSRSWGRRTSPDASGGSYAVSSGNSLAPGSAWFHFTGDSVSWQGWTRFSYQDVEFLVDGQTIAVKDLFDQSEGTRSFSFDGFGPGLHVLEVRQIRAFVASLDQVTTPAVGTPDPEPVLPPIVRYEEYHPSMSYSGLPAEVMPRTWTSSAVLQASRGRIHSSSTPGDVWRIDFDGQWIALGFRSTESSGTAEVFIDGASRGIIDTSGGVNQSKSFTYGGLSAGPHVLEVVVQSGTISPDFADVWDGQPVPDGVYDVNLEAAPQNLVHLSYRSWWREGFDDYAVDDDFLAPFASSQTNSWFTFTGNSLTVLAYERDGTEVQIAIDGVDQGVFDLSSEAPFRTQPRAIHFNNLGDGPHIVHVYNSAVGLNTSRIDAFESNPEDFATHKPVVEWFDTSAQETLPGGEGTGFLSTIAIGDLQGDGLVELIAPSLNGRLYVYRGDGQDAGNGSPILWSSDVAGPVAEPALADLDGDGTAEIIVSGRDGTFAFRHNGQLLWSNPDVKSFFTSQNLPWGGPTVANMDLDPEPEIVISAIGDALYVLDHLGSVEFSEPLGTDFPTVPILADLTNDGVLDIVVAEAWNLRVLDYQNGGVEVWDRELPDPINVLGGAGAFGSPAIADLDGDGRPEVIINWGHVVEALQDDGTLLWRYETGRTDLYRPSPVTVADVTGDGQIDIVTASAISSGFIIQNHLMMVIDAGGSLIWEQNVADGTASASGVAAQDLTGNGAWEIIWNGSQDGFLILNGPDGDRFYNEPFTGSGTVLDYPTLGDVDGDGEAEIVTAGANGLFVIGHAGRWADSRPVWNQHNYHINNINNDWSVPFTQENSWETHNTYRTQTPDREPGCLLDDGVPVPAEFVELSPEPGAVLPSGLPLVISGRVLPVAPSQPILSVDVNSVPVDLLDPSGAFFARVELPSGENSLTLRAVDRCGTSTIDLGLNGGRDAASPWADLADASVLLEARFAATTRDLSSERLLVNVQAFNEGPSVPGPVLMAVGSDIDPAVSLLNADGFTPQGEPYVVIVPEGEILPAGGLSTARELAFANPELRPIDFTPRWIAPVNQPPVFTSIPEPRATIDQPWVYAAATVDGNGDDVTLRLDSAPAGMSIVGGEVQWTPSAAGNYEIVLLADDGRGGVATQGFTVQVTDASFNRPPVFTSSPDVQRPIGAEYVYDADASDLDGDSLSYSLQAAPDGVTVDSLSGEVRWASAMPGQHSMVLNVDDGRGGQATQAWTLYVGEPALTQPGPAFGSVPVTYATPGVQYRYVYRVNSPLPAPPDVSLAQGPANMVLDPVAGTLIWVPTGADLGLHVIELLAVDSNGEEARQRFDIQVLPQLPNQPPYLTSNPVSSARIGSPYSYQATAIDPEFEALTFSLASAPSGMSIDAVTGQVDWLPQAGDPAEPEVTVRVEDPQGGQATQTFTVRLRAANVDPVITSVPPTSVTVGAFYSSRLLAEDADGDPVSFRLLEGPQGMTLHPTLGWLHWVTTGEAPGAYPIVLEATDDWGGRDELSFVLTLLKDVEPPQVSIRQTPSPVCQDQVATVCLEASDNVGLASLALTIDGNDIALDASRCAVWNPTDAGSIPALATVADPSGQVGQDNTPLTVFDCNDEQAPVVRLISPLPGSRHDVPVPIVVDIEDNTPAQLTWEVVLRRVGSEGEQLLASGAGEVSAGEVAQFNPQLLQAGDYTVEVIGADGAQTGGIQFPLAAGTGQKAGRVAFTQQDMAWQLGAFPLVVGRSYDSLDAGPAFISESDFGPGWRLAFSAQVEDSANDVAGPAGALGAEPFTNQTRVTVIKPNGERVGFTFDPQSRSFPSVFQFDVVYTPDDGVTDSLRAIDFPDVVWALGAGYANYIIPYNPSLYELETEDGVVYLISEFDGLLEVRDAIGGVVTASEDGWVSSWGARVDYERDAEDRITDIVLIGEDGTTEIGRLEYAYDAIGNLVSATDLAGGTRTFEYADADLPHHITGLFDPLGRPESRIVFDDQGRQIAYCPGGADPVTLDGCSLFGFDGDVQTQFVFDGRGFESQLFFDEAGQLIQRRDEVEAGLFAEQNWTFDEAGRETEYIDADGGVTRTEWDESGNRTRLEEPGGRVTTWEWGDCHGEEEWLERCDALANCTTQELDASCRVTRRIDPLGGEIVFEYDSNGQRTATVDSVDQRIESEFGPRGNRIRFTDALGGDVLSTYGDLGELTSEVERDGSRREWTYDDAGQVETETWVGDGDSGISWTHDVANFVDGLSWPDANVDVSYWPNGKVRRMTHSSDTAPDWWIEYSYDANDNVIRLEDSFGGITEYDYNGLNQIVEVRQSGPGIATKRVVIETSNTGQPVRMQRYASIDDSQPGPVTELEYACLSCPTTLTRILHTRPDTTVIHDLVYQRNDTHQITILDDADGTHEFVYDGRGWLIQADHPPGFAGGDQQFGWDGAGNWLTRTGAFGGAETATLGYQTGQGGHRLLSDGVNSYEYDARGGLVERSGPSGRIEIERDARGNPILITEYDAGDQVISTASYVYSSNQQRVRAERDGQVRHYIFDGPNPIIALDSAGQVVWRQLHLREADRPLAMDVEGQLSWLLLDHIGSVRDQVDNAGQVLASFSYDAFGRQLSGPAPTIDDPVRFTGREFDLPGGLGYFRLRLYDPFIGRFLSTDIIEPWHYRYADNNPLNFVDPSGAVVALEYFILICDDILGTANTGGGERDAVIAAFEGNVRKLLKQLAANLYGAAAPCGISPSVGDD